MLRLCTPMLFLGLKMGIQTENESEMELNIKFEMQPKRGKNGNKFDNEIEVKLKVKFDDGKVRWLVKCLVRWLRG